MTANGQSTDRPVGPMRRLSERQPRSRAAFALGRPAYWIGRAGGRLMIAAAGWEQGIRRRRQVDVGSFSIGRGGTDSRTWFVTGSLGSVYLDLTLARFGSGSRSVRSASGRAGIRTSGSSKSYSVVASTIGTEEATPAEPPRQREES